MTMKGKATNDESRAPGQSEVRPGVFSDYLPGALTNLAVKPSGTRSKCEGVML